MRDLEVIWVRQERKYFCKQGWTAELPSSPSGKSASLSAIGSKSEGRRNPPPRAKSGSLDRRRRGNASKVRFRFELLSGESSFIDRAHRDTYGTLQGEAARFRHAVTRARAECLISGEQRKTSDPGCVKTPTSDLRVESLSRLRRITKEPLWQSPSKEEKRENNSAHSLLVRVFTQPGPIAEVAAAPDSKCRSRKGERGFDSLHPHRGSAGPTPGSPR